MCGIAGIVAPTSSPEQIDARLSRMLPGIASRGPDGTGCHVSAGVGLLHTRLAIIDLETGDQPIWNERRTVACIFNGEIYNYRDLARDLAARGHTLATRSDTEVLVHLYEDHGEHLFDHIHGMYALALYDTEKRVVLLGRDRLGIKPLYVSRIDGAIAFASSIDSLVAAGASPEIDPVSAAQLLRFGKVPEPRTIHASICALAPGTCAIVDAASADLVERRFLPPRPRDAALDPDEAAHHARARFAKAVEAHLIADVEVAAFLSGGIDSSLVVAQAQRLSDRPLRTFCVSFEGAGDDVDEARFAARVASAVGTRHETLVVSAPPAQLVRDAVRAAQQPFAVASFLPLLLLCREASKRVKVVLTGDGGDEVAFGYPWYRWMRAAARWPRWLRAQRASRALRAIEARSTRSRPLRRATKLARGVIAGQARASDAWRYELEADEASALLRRDLRPARIEQTPTEAAWDRSLDDVEALREADLRVLLRDEMLPKLDRAGMAHGLEGRPPLLDDEFVDAMLAVPAHVHLADRRGKALLRAWARELVPGVDAERPKHGFDVPIQQWLETNLHDDVRRLLLEPSRDGLLDSRAVDAVWQRAKAGSPGAAHAVYAMLVLELWRESRA